MAVKIKHKKVVNKPDGPDESVVRPTNWNEDHSVLMTGPALVGKDSVNEGEAIEITLADDFKFEGGELCLNPDAGFLKKSQSDQLYASKASLEDLAESQSQMAETVSLAITYDEVSGMAKLPNGDLVSIGGTLPPVILSVGNGSVTFED